MPCEKDNGQFKKILGEKRLDGSGGQWREAISRVSGGDVEKTLSEQAGHYNIERILALISPAAEEYLEEMAQQAHRLTVQRFGRTIRLYAPLYVSSYCENSCLYCGFSRNNQFERRRLTIDEAAAEADIIASEGFTDLLLVSSEDRKFITVDYLCELARRLRGKFSTISAEIYPLSADEYRRLFEAGIEGVTLYQETYDRNVYSRFHPAGPKSDYDSRLDAPNRFAGAGMRQVGIGALLGLNDFRLETLALAEHGHYLMKRYWQSQLSFSFPRLRPANNVSSIQFEHILSGRNLVQMITALRLCFADAGLVLSTREGAKIRDNAVKLGITKMSAGSKTSPGGYSGNIANTGQFEIDDKRTPIQIAEMLKSEGFEPVWKDWERALSKV
jgi:2-iminoacetate synthase